MPPEADEAIGKGVFLEEIGDTPFFFLPTKVIQATPEQHVDALVVWGDDADKARAVQCICAPHTNDKKHSMSLFIPADPVDL